MVFMEMSGGFSIGCFNNAHCVLWELFLSSLRLNFVYMFWVGIFTSVLTSSFSRNQDRNQSEIGNGSGICWEFIFVFLFVELWFSGLTSSRCVLC